MITYSIIIPTYNAVQTLVPLLESITPQLVPAIEVIVVDDASTDDTVRRIAGFPVTCLVQGANAGPAAARNRGAAAASGVWLIFTDADTEFRPDTLLAIKEALDRSGGDALVGTYAGKPANFGLIPRYKALWEYCAIDQRMAVDDYGLARYFTWAPRPGVVRKSVFEAVGGFDTRFRGADLEDLDLGYRLVDAGYTIFYSERVRILHHYPDTLLGELRPFARRCAIWMRMRRRWPKLDGAGEGAPGTALAHLAGSFAAISLPVAVVRAEIAAVSGVFLLVHWGLNARFLRASWREGGPVFAGACAGLTWLHSAVLGAAALWGLLTPQTGK
jgi:glycosyltransferase involved in cell wall biosynthesis